MKTAQECVGKRLLYKYGNAPMTAFLIDVVGAFKDAKTGQWMVKVSSAGSHQAVWEWSFDTELYWQEIPDHIDRWSERIG